MSVKGRGSQSFINNRFDSNRLVKEHIEGIDEDSELDAKTQIIEVFPKSILNRVKSPDIPVPYSLNPYQGCEHGCIYCYARNSHEYWGYNAGIDFEQKILVKKNATELLAATFRKKNYQPETIMLSGNTDCYQPIERKLKITRSILETCLRYKHPIGIITKNALVTRDIDLLQELAKDDLIHVIISVTSLNEELRRTLEPRTSTSAARLNTIRLLSEAGIPTMVLMAPVIPALNSEEILTIAKAVSQAGAKQFAHQIVRLNGQLEELFSNWLSTHYPDRKEKVLNQIREVHGGTIQDNRFGVRMRGEGNIAKQISDLVKIARSNYFKDKKMPEFRTDLFNPDVDNPQYKMDF